MTSAPRASPARNTFRPPELRVKLEGSGKVGERYVGMVGVRDPYTIANIDEVIAWARQQAAERFGATGIRTALHGLWPQRRHGRLRAAEGDAGTRAVHRRAGRRADAAMAEEVCMIGTRQMFYARLPQVKGTAGGVAFLLDEVMPASPAYRWTLNHTLGVDDPLELFPTSSPRRRVMTASRKLSEIAKTIRSKNAGVDKITFDVIFTDRADL